MIEIEFNNPDDLEAIAEQLYGFSISLANRCIAYVENFDFSAFRLACDLAGIKAINPWQQAREQYNRARQEYEQKRQERAEEWERVRPTIQASEEDTAIYIACLAAYNEGFLHGIWIDAEQDLEAIQEAIATMLKYSPSFDAEEYAIHDYQGFNDIRIGEHENLEKIHNLAIAISEHGKAFSIWWNLFGQYDETADFEDEYLGEYDSKEDYVWEMLESTIAELDKMKIAGIPIGSYLDLEKIARDWECSGLHFERRSGKVYVFS